MLRKLALVVLIGSSIAARSPSSDPGPDNNGGSGGKSGSGGNGSGGNKGSGGSGAGGSGGSASGGAGGGSGGSTGGASGGSGGSTDGGSPDTGGGETGPVAESGLLTNPTMPWPMKISETGVFKAPPNFDMRPERVHFYVPSPALYSDGLDKLRYIIMPKDTKIDNNDPLHWKFPPGVIFVKTFLDGAGGKHPVETRFIRRLNEFSWQYAVYQWNAEGTEATLAPNDETNRIPVKVNVAGKEFMHNIPSKNDCGECHDNADKSAPEMKVIGFDELRLGGKATASDAKVQLDHFADLGFFEKAMRPMAQRRVINEPNPLLKPVLEYVFGNCVHCHNANAGQFDLSPEVFVMNTVRKPNMAQSVKPPDNTYQRIVPKMPEKSIVYIQARSTNLPNNTFRAMPPVGVQFPPTEQIEAIRTWILSLP